MTDEKNLRARLATLMVARAFRIAPDDLRPDMGISNFVDTPRERAFLAHLFNGPMADWAMEQGDVRWVTIKPADLEGLTTVIALIRLCFRHLILESELSGREDEQ